MNKPSLVITGANGFIGEYLVNYFGTKEFKITALAHIVPDRGLKDVLYLKYNLEETVLDSIFENVDYLIHCAFVRYDRNKKADEINLNGMKEIISVCRRTKTKIIFLSSFSAHELAVSHYGKNKLSCEKLLDLKTDVVIKPGLVLGEKGLCLEMIKRMKTSSSFPLVGGGNQPLQTIFIDDLAKCIQVVMNERLTGVFYLAEPKAIPMKAFYSELSSQLKVKIKYYSVSAKLVYYICKFSETFGIKLAASSENVLGLKQLITFDTKSDLNKLGVELKDYKESIKTILKK